VIEAPLNTNVNPFLRRFPVCFNHILSPSHIVDMASAIEALGYVFVWPGFMSTSTNLFSLKSTFTRVMQLSELQSIPTLDRSRRFGLLYRRESELPS
jgi:hypothetical protein